MSPKKVFFITIAVLVFLVGLYLSTAIIPPASAELNITPTLYASAWRYLPIIRRLKEGPTPTATTPPPTRTPYFTITPSPTGTDIPPDFTPSPTTTSTTTSTPTLTPTATPTREGEPATRERLIGYWEFYSPSGQVEFTCMRYDQCSTGSFVEFYADGRFYLYRIYYNPGPGDPVVERKKPGSWTINQGLLTLNYDDHFQVFHDVRKLLDWDHLTTWRRDNGRVTFMKRGVSPPTATPTPTPTNEPAEPVYSCEFELFSEYNSRRSMTVTALQDGRALIAGGYDYTNQLETGKEILIFDPQTRRFEKVIALNNSRGAHSAILLNDGNVLITANLPDNVADIYDVHFGTIEHLEDFPGQIYSSMGITLDGRVLINDLGVLYLFNPYLKTVEYLEYSSLIYTDIGAPIARVGNNEFFILGGYGDIHVVDVNSKTGEIIDYITSRWVSPTILPIDIGYGKVLIAGGGYHIRGTGKIIPLREAYLFDYADKKSNRVGDIISPRIGQASVRLENGNVMISGGQGVIDTYWDYLSSIEIFDASKEKFYEAGNLIIPRSGHQTVLLANGEILVYGGQMAHSGITDYPPPEIGRCEKH